MQRIRAAGLFLLAAGAILATPAMGETGRAAYAKSHQPGAAARHGRRNDALVALGQALFSDTRLSADGTVACVTCHRPEMAYTDGKPVAEGIQGKRGTRNTPSLLNAAYAQPQFWDGRRATLEAQVLDPFVNPNEHGLPDRPALLAAIRRQADDGHLFQKALGKPAARAELSDLAQALAAYVRSLNPTRTRLERFLFAADTDALDPAEQRGLALFRGRAQCAACHTIGAKAAPLTDGRYHSLAVGLDRLAPKLAALTRKVANTPRGDLDRLVASDADIAALGRFAVTLKPTDIGAFKTPSLYAVAATVPYMHDGSIATLEAALERELYYRGRDSGRPLALSVTERADLLAFLRGLGGQPHGER